MTICRPNMKGVQKRFQIYPALNTLPNGTIIAVLVLQGFRYASPQPVFYRP